MPWTAGAVLVSGRHRGRLVSICHWDIFFRIANYLGHVLNCCSSVGEDTIRQQDMVEFGASCAVYQLAFQERISWRHRIAISRVHRRSRRGNKTRSLEKRQSSRMQVKTCTYQ